MNPRNSVSFVLVALALGGCSKKRSDPAPTAPAPVPETGAFAGDSTTPVDLQQGYSWIYEGPDAPQIGVVPGTIDRARICLVHGRVIDEVGEPLGGVRIEVVGRPEFGHTFTAAGGDWTMAVNGGVALDLRMVLAGRAPAQRQVAAGWRGQYALRPVVLVQRSTTATPMQGESATPQLAIGDENADADGTRKDLLYVPPGTRATAVMADGSEQGLPTFTVRSTEYTVGERGEERMPGDYAANIAYTYAIDYVCDEAEAIDAAFVDGRVTGALIIANGIPLQARRHQLVNDPNWITGR